MFSSGGNNQEQETVQEFADAAVSQTEVDLDDLEVDFERADGSELHADEYEIEEES